METFLTWIQDHRWRALTGAVTALCLYALPALLLPRARAAYATFIDWRHQEGQIAAVEGWAAERPGLDRRTTRLRRRFATLYVSLPRSDHMSTILQVLQESGSAAGVAIQQVRPGEGIEHAAYEEVPFEVEALGGFHALGAFVSRIEQSPYVIKLRRLEIHRTAPGAVRLRAAVSLSVIVLHEQRGPE